MHNAIYATPLNFGAYLGYDIIRSSYEDQLSSLGHILSCMVNPAIGHQGSQFLCRGQCPTGYGHHRASFLRKPHR
jgi:hypothetical protein